MDITQLILDDHQELRRLFAIIEQIDHDNIAALGSVWKRLAALLDVHAEAEERYFYPDLLKLGRGAGTKEDAAAETEDAIDDHNDIRDAAAAVNDHDIGSGDWFAAVDKANLVNSKHMAEEEREGLTDFRRNAPMALRHALAQRFIAFDTRHVAGIEAVDKDPRTYIAEHGPA